MPRARDHFLQACQKLDEERVDRGWALLLNPMPGTRQHHLVPEVGHRFLEGVEVLSVHREHRVNLARNEEGRLV